MGNGLFNIEPTLARLRSEVLSPDQLVVIRNATLEILDQVGVQFPSERALRVFAEHGARVDQDSQIVRLSPDLVEAAMEKAPRAYLLAGRVEGTDLLLDGSRSYFGTDGCGVHTIDLRTGEQRASRKADVAMMAHVCDYLTSVAFYWPMVSAQDCGRTAPLHEVEASFANTAKHVQTETVMGEAPAQYAVRMAEVIAGDSERLRSHPPLSSLVCTIAPLAQDQEGIEAAMVFAEAGIPVGFMSMPTIGSTAPATTAGALVVGNAEVVSAMVLMQLVAPGAPVYHSLIASVMDPRTAEYIAGIGEKYLCNTAAVQIAHDWGVPTLAGSFGVDCPDPASWQLGRDSVYSALMVALHNAEMASGLGMLKASTVLLPEQIIFDDELYHMNRVVAEGIPLGVEKLALDEIKAVGPKGHFLAQKHTRKHIRDIWIPRLTHPVNVEGGGGIDVRRRARAELERILGEHKPEPLDEAVKSELEAILTSAEKEAGD
jgi:trimethylamine--corrinoid protein Co-methyltransferase